MKKLLLGLALAVSALFTAPAFAAGPADCASLPPGYIRDGAGNCSQVAKVDSAGNLQVAYGLTSDLVNVSGSATSATNLIGPIDVSGYNSFALQITSAGSGNTLIVEGSNDQTNWSAISVMPPGNLASTPSTGVGAALANVWAGEVRTQFLRVRVSAYGSGTVSVAMTLRRGPGPTYGGYQYVNGNFADGVADGGAPVKVGCKVAASTLPTYSDGQRSNCTSGGRGGLRLHAPTTTVRLLSAAASTNATLIKSTPGDLFQIIGYNASTSVRYLKIYNKASAPTVGTDTPILTLPIPPSTGFAFDWPEGYWFSTGMSFAITTGSPDADTGALTAGDVVGLNIMIQ